MRIKLLTLLFALSPIFIFGQGIHEIWSVDGLGTFVLIGGENMDDDPARELVYVEHSVGAVNFNPRIVIFDGVTGNVDYDTGPGMQDNYNIAGFNWTTTGGSNINSGFNALYDLDGDGRFELVYNRNGQTNEVIGWDGSSISILWAENGLGTFVLIGAEQMDNDAALEAVFLTHTTGVVNFNPRIAIFDGITGAVEYDTGPGMQDNYNVAGFNWTTTGGSDVNSGMEALHDLDSDGIFELVYNRNGQTNEVVGWDGNNISIRWTQNGLGTYILIGAEQMDNDPVKEIVFVEHTVGVVNFNPRIVIMDGQTGGIDYDTGPGVQDNYNVAGFNWTTTGGSDINSGREALFDVDGDGIFELAYNKNGQDNELVGWDGSNINILWSVDGLGTFVLIGAGQMDNDAQRELVFLEHTFGVVNFNPRFAIFDGNNGNVDYDTGPGVQDNFNVAGFNWTTTGGSNVNAGLEAIHNIEGDGDEEIIYNRNGQTIEVVGWDGNAISILDTWDALGTYILAGVEQMDPDDPLELVFVRNIEGTPNYTPRFAIFDGMTGNVDYDTGPGINNNYNVAGFNWTTSGGSNTNSGFYALFDVDNNGRHEMSFNLNGSDNKLIGWDVIQEIPESVADKDPGISVFPNPFSERATVYITGLSGEIFSVIVFNSNGQKVKTIDGIAGNEFILEKGNMVDGIYFLQLISGDEIIGSRKIVLR
jgi:hypothetical protein